jgi:hypothetical protein
VVERWLKALDRYGIGVSHNLQWSFQKQIVLAGGDVDRVIFKFLQYGRFVDMGVGRGQSLTEMLMARRERYRGVDGKMTAGPGRKPKPWYTKTFYREVAKLSELYQAKYSEKIVTITEKALSGSITLNPI